jgi:hypothetical protein
MSYVSQLGADDTPVLADFGLARSHTQSMSIRKTASGPFGTLNWMAPEMIAETAVSQAIDVYAFGIIVWEMCSGMIPWAGLPVENIVFKVAVKGERPTVERERWPAWACDLMEACWHQDPKQRLIMADVLARLRAVGAPIAKPVPEDWHQKGRAFATGTAVVAKDEREAVKWYRLAAEHGHAWAQFDLGACYYNGRGVPKDERESVKWYRLAAEQGHAHAQANLGYCYKHGVGVAKDEREAVKWFRPAADQGRAGAQFNLGQCYQRGAGVAKDEREAIKWFQLAAEQGHSDAVTALQRLGV